MQWLVRNYSKVSFSLERCRAGQLVFAKINHYNRILIIDKPGSKVFQSQILWINPIKILQCPKIEQDKSLTVSGFLIIPNCCMLAHINIEYWTMIKVLLQYTKKVYSWWCAVSSIVNFFYCRSLQRTVCIIVMRSLPHCFTLPAGESLYRVMASFLA